MLIPLEVGFVVGLEEPPTFMPPPQPDHRAITKDKTSALANLVREDVAIPIISDPLSRRSEVLRNFRLARRNRRAARFSSGW